MSGAGGASVSSLLLDNARLRSKLAEVQAALARAAGSPPRPQRDDDSDGDGDGDGDNGPTGSEPTPRDGPTLSPPAAAPCGLSPSSAVRHSRHLLLAELGNHPLLFVRAVQTSAVLVVGAGGLGCPALLYLAAAGVGRLGVVDGDVVDPSNLPRQVLFDDRHVGRSKAEAACARLRLISPQCAVECYATAFVPGNAESLCRGYDVLLDCSDNVATRYLCNDVAVLLGIPCVSASALRLEGQLSVYGGRADGGPCYRCLFPLPVAAHMVTNCNEGGILNAVTGVMGSLQAMEALKCIALSRQTADEQRGSAACDATRVADAACTASPAAPYGPYRCPALSGLSGRLLLFDGGSATFRSVRLRGRSAQCAVCGDSDWRRISLATLREPQQYSALCSADGAATFNDAAAAAAAEALLGVSSISVAALAAHLQRPEPRLPFVLLDVRPSLQFDIARLPRSINVPRDQLSRRWPDVERAIQQAASSAQRAAQGDTAADAAAAPRQPATGSGSGSGSGSDCDRGSWASGGAEQPHCRLFVVCRRGVDSLHAARWIHEKQQQQQQRTGAEVTACPPLVSVDVLNVEGGLMAWSEHVDSRFPVY